MEDEKFVTLRPITEEDTNLIVKWRNNSRVRDNFIFQKEFNKQIHEKWLKEVVEKGQAIQYIICLGKEYRPIGSVYFSHVSEESAEFGIFIGEDDLTGKGFGQRAARLILEKGFEEIGFGEIYLRVFTDNIVAIKSYEKSGFVKEELLKDVECTSGIKRDMYRMKITYDDWRKKKRNRL